VIAVGAVLMAGLGERARGGHCRDQPRASAEQSMSSLPQKGGEGHCTTPRQRLRIMKLNEAIRTLAQRERAIKELRRQEGEELLQMIREDIAERKQKEEEARQRWEARPPEEKEKLVQGMLADLDAASRRDPD
jgi:hypothetical protein